MAYIRMHADKDQAPLDYSLTLPNHYSSADAGHYSISAHAASDNFYCAMWDSMQADQSSLLHGYNYETVLDTINDKRYAVENFRRFLINHETFPYQFQLLCFYIAKPWLEL